jgi:hypothetical protein
MARMESVGATEGVVRVTVAVKAMQGAEAGSRLWGMEDVRGMGREDVRGMGREVVMRTVVGMEGSREVVTSSGVDMSRVGMRGVRDMVEGTEGLLHPTLRVTLGHTQLCMPTVASIGVLASQEVPPPQCGCTAVQRGFSAVCQGGAGCGRFSCPGWMSM